MASPIDSLTSGQEFLLWYTGALTTVITFLFGVVIYFAKDKIMGFLQSSKITSKRLENLEGKLDQQDKAFDAFRGKIIGDVRQIFLEIGFMKKQTEKVPEIEVKTEKILVVVEAQKTRLEDFGKVIVKNK